jgi:hypothetical protein
MRTPKADERDRRIVERWLDRRRAERRSADVLTFYGWLLDHDPTLIPPGPRSYEHVRALVAPLVVDER